MPGVQPQLTASAVRDLLTEHFHAPDGPLTPVGGGQIAQTFAFRADGQDYIIRINRDNMLVNLEKEAYIYQHLAAPGVPIPPVLQVGRLDGLVYAVSQKMPGERMTALPPAEVAAAIPALIAPLDAIHGQDVRGTTGYGVFDSQGRAPFHTWRQVLAIIREEEPPEDFYGRWHHMFHDTFLEQPVFDRIYAAMIRLLDHCPEDRYLVHGDYGFTNVLLQNGRVTAVLDWLNAKYGDFVYDIAWLDFWAPALGFPARFAAYYADQGRMVPAYAERLLCYECYISLDGLRFFAKTGDEAAYRYTRDQILARLG